MLERKRKPFTGWPSGPAPKYHQWEEIPLPPAPAAPPPPPSSKHHWVKIRLVECRRCRLALAIYAEPNETHCSLEPELKCVRSHLSRQGYNETETEANTETRARHQIERSASQSEITETRFHSVCGFNYRWKRADTAFYEVIVNEVERRPKNPGQLPWYIRVNCPDCLQAAQALTTKPQGAAG